ncbi:hypothetical protein BN946_scf184970.g116 [Trametes cinnabarina]|uniref:Uncharacterized protein n=1 Tax=Pycnoporus cinnabarinus TaxID=5643 RepID=A0A060SJ79_PYCCI|nr:hypothetical protein BN946_scf184970.g116 [Trametes cinnabarina]
MPDRGEEDVPTFLETRRQARRRNPQFVHTRRSLPYESSDDMDGTISSGRGHTSAGADLAPRSSLFNEVAWAFVRGRHEFVGTVQPWRQDRHFGVAYPLWNAVRGDPPSPWRALSRLHLELDTVGLGKHLHDLYLPEANNADFPNVQAGEEIVGLCRSLGGRLTGLSITMCIPELTIPHVPSFVYGILRQCPMLEHLGLEDTQCSDCSPEWFMYLCAAVSHDVRLQQDQQQGAQRWRPRPTFPLRTRLQTFVISKRSVIPWRKSEQDFATEEALDNLMKGEMIPLIRMTRLPEQMVLADNTNFHIEKCQEACKLRDLMTVHMPSLQRVYVALDRLEDGSSAVDLRSDAKGEFPPLTAGEVYSTSHVL